MAKLIYSAIASADGYIEDPDGSIDWGMPDEELLGFINELEQPARTYLYARIGVECEDTGRTGLRARPCPAAEVGRRA